VVIAILIVVGLWLWRSGIIHGSSANPPAAAVSAAMAMTSPLPMHSGAARVAPPPLRPVEAGSGAAAAGASSRLELKLAVSSWVEVYDAHGRRLYYDLASAGQILKLQSSALPFRIFLGNAAGASIELNGKPVSVPAAGTSGTGVRFEVPAATASAASPASVSAPGAAT
ncbi:MAG TPA: DUF4115 domain-containing protein, partial [Gammaproteobacteria bacterium]|nr:DUF4115 domain-containing protein [Gammaproteobacteria bacterium]